MNISKSLFLSIYDIGIDQIKGKLKDFILSIESSDATEKDDYLIFEFTLVISKNLIKGIIIKLSNYFEEYKDSRTFSTVWDTFDGQIDYLIKGKKLTELEPVSKMIKILIDNYKKNKRVSVL